MGIGRVLKDDSKGLTRVESDLFLWLEFFFGAVEPDFAEPYLRGFHVDFWHQAGNCFTQARPNFGELKAIIAWRLVGDDVARNVGVVQRVPLRNDLHTSQGAGKQVQRRFPRNGDHGGGVAKPLIQARVLLDRDESIGFKLLAPNFEGQANGVGIVEVVVNQVVPGNPDGVAVRAAGEGHVELDDVVRHNRQLRVGTPKTGRFGCGGLDSRERGEHASAVGQKVLN